jgi:hypothetical protein
MRSRRGSESIARRTAACLAEGAPDRAQITRLECYGNGVDDQETGRRGRSDARRACELAAVHRHAPQAPSTSRSTDTLAALDFILVARARRRRCRGGRAGPDANVVVEPCARQGILPVCWSCKLCRNLGPLGRDVLYWGLSIRGAGRGHVLVRAVAHGGGGVEPSMTQCATAPTTPPNLPLAAAPRANSGG